MADTTNQPQADAAQPQQQGQGSEIPNLDPNSRIRMPDKDGSIQEPTLAEMADAYRNRGEALTPEQKEEFDLFNRAKQNDPEAIKTLAERMTPPVQPTVEQDAGALQQQVTALQEQLNQVGEKTKVTEAVSQAIIQMAQNQQASQVIQTAKEQYPYVAHHPQGSQKLINKIGELNQLAQTRGIDPNKADPAFHDQIRTTALDLLNKEIQAEIAPFGGQIPGQTQPPPQRTVTDDQNAGGRTVLDPYGKPSDGRRFGDNALPEDVPAIQARYYVNEAGQLIDRGAQQVYANPQSSQAAGISDRPIQKLPVGNPAGVAQPQQSGILTFAQLRQNMAARNEEMGGTQ